MLNAGVLTFKEFASREPLPLATIRKALKEFGATAEEMTTWRELVAQELVAPNDDDEFN